MSIFLKNTFLKSFVVMITLLSFAPMSAGAAEYMAAQDMRAAKQAPAQKLARADVPLLPEETASPLQLLTDEQMAAIKGYQAATSPSRMVLPAFTLPTAAAAPRADLLGDRLAEAEAADASLRYVDALEGYADVMERGWNSPRRAEANAKLVSMLNAMGRAEFLSFGDAVFAREDIESVPGKLQIIKHHRRSHRRAAEGQEADAKTHLDLLMDYCERFMERNADCAEQLEVVNMFVTSAKLLGPEAEARAYSKLEDVIAAHGPSVVSWQARAILEGEEPPVSYVPTAREKTFLCDYLYSMGIWHMEDELDNKSKGQEVALDYIGSIFNTEDEPHYRRDAAMGRDYLRRTQDAVLEAIGEHPNSAQALQMIHFFQGCAEALGPEERLAVAEFEDVLAEQGATMATWSVRVALARYHGSMADVEGKGAAAARAALVDTAASGVESAINDPALTVETRVVLEVALGDALFFAGRSREAMAQYAAVLTKFADFYGEVAWLDHAGYYWAYLTGHIVGTYDEGIAAFDRIYADFPESEYAPQAAWQVGNLLYAKQEYVDAYYAYEFVVSQYPDTKAAANAAAGMNSLLEHHVDRRELASARTQMDPDPNADAIALHALAKLRRGAAASSELVDATDTEPADTPTPALQQAASAKKSVPPGMAIVSIDAPEPPFSADTKSKEIASATRRNSDARTPKLAQLPDDTGPPPAVPPLIEDDGKQANAVTHAGESS